MRAMCHHGRRSLDTLRSFADDGQLFFLLGIRNQVDANRAKEYSFRDEVRMRPST